MTRLPEIEYRILAALESGKAMSVDEIRRKIGGGMETIGTQLLREQRDLPPGPGMDQSLVMAGAKQLEQKGFVTIRETHYEEFSLTHPDDAVSLSGGTRELLPERKAVAR